MVSKPFVTKYKIPVVKSQFKYAQMADKSKVLLEGETTPFQIDLQGIKTSIKGLVMPNINYDIVAGMDWFTRVNPSVCWKTKTITINRNGGNFNILKEPNDLILRDTVFVQVINLDDSDHLTKDSTLHIMRYTEFNNVHTSKLHPPKFAALLKEYAHVFKEELKNLPPEREVKHGIDLCKAMPKPAPLYRLSPMETQTLKAHIEDNLAKGFIRPSESPWGAAVFFVKKKEGTLRLVTDYRALNASTVKNKYPLPLIEDLFARLSGAKFFSKIDLTSGYNQVEVKEKDIPKTAFRTQFGSFECRVMNFGMTNAPATFVTMMNQALNGLSNTLCYLDDIIVFSKTKEEHLTHVRKTLD